MCIVTQRSYRFGREPEILSHLLHNGRASLNDIAKAIDQNRQKVWRTLKGLEEDVIWGYSVVMDERRLGWSRYLLLVTTGNLNRSEAKNIISHYNDSVFAKTVVIHAIHATGHDNHHWVVELTAKSSLTLKNAVRSLRSEFPNSFPSNPVVIELLTPVRMGCQDNPDKEALGELLDELEYTENNHLADSSEPIGASG